QRVLWRAAAFLLTVSMRPVGAENATFGRSFVKLASKRHHVVPAARLRRHARAIAEQHPHVLALEHFDDPPAIRIAGLHAAHVIDQQWNGCELAEHVDVVGEFLAADEDFGVPAHRPDAVDGTAKALRRGRHLELPHEIEPDSAYAAVV